jgi:hypothetical protein
MKETQIIVET